VTVARGPFASQSSHESNTARAEGRFEEFLNDEALYVDAVMNWEI
jgi:hypothetical protein